MVKKIVKIAVHLSFINSIPPEINYHQTAMGLPPVTSAVFLIAK
jgi:hypothetical protein